MSLRNVCVVATALLAMAILTHGLTTTGMGGGFAFGAVQQQVEKTKSVQYVQTRTDHNKDGKAAPQEMRKVAILGGHQMREEVTVTTAGDPLPEGERWSTVPGKHIMIQNVKTGKAITLFPDERGYIVPLATLSLDADSGEIEEHEIEAAPKIDFYQRIREVPADKAMKLPDRTIGDEAAVGFQTVEKFERSGGTDTWTRTYWVDPETKLPVRIETTFRSTHKMMSGESEWVDSDIVFDAPLDETLFSTDPPEGYKNLASEDSRKDKAEKSDKEN